ncbi:MAG TPA: helical backbone metal receptor [Vicinamibacterales bacterium]|nr:helical backbone metal receptor [Vicinamibacterales bacterium]
MGSVPIFYILVIVAACAAPQPPAPVSPPQRIISLIPAVTETLFAVGAGSKVVGVGTFDTWPPAVANIARVGGLIDPDTERILALKPDLAFLYGSQEELIAQLTRAGIAIETYRHGGLADIVSSVRAVGARVGHQAEAERAASDIERGIAAIRARTASLPKPRTLIVFGREEGALRTIFASGGTGFIHDMVDAAGGQNVFADVGRESVQASLESILERAPEVILEIRAATAVRDPGWADAARRAWSTAASLPAVRDRRVRVLLDERLVVPGPRVVEGIELIAAALGK